MNSKKIFISIFIIIAIVFMTANVFAYTTKGPIPEIANNNKGNIFNLKINDIKYIKYSEPIKIPEVGDKTYCGHIELKTNVVSGINNLAMGVIISRPFVDKSIYPKYMSELYVSGYEGKNQFQSREHEKLWMYSPGSNSSTNIIYLYNENLCSASHLDVYIFKPYYKVVKEVAKSGLKSYLIGIVSPIASMGNVIYDFTTQSILENFQNKVYVHSYVRGILTQKYKVSVLYLNKNSNLLYNINAINTKDGEVYFYNVDYAYGIVPVTGSSTQSPSTPNSSLQSANQNTTAIPCDSSFRTATELGYQASWTYKCTDDKTGYYKCENGVSHGPYTFSRTSRLKPLICTSESTETTESTTTTETSQNKVVLTIENNTNISDINYSLDNTNWYSTKKIDFPKSFILGNKTNNKTINVDLDMFTEGTIYAIVSTVDKKTEIDNELKTIYQTGNFTGYNLQTASNVFEINNTLSLSKLQYTLDNTKKVKLNISNNITNGDLVIIFMQKSQDNSKVNLVYSNLYVLDEKEQSQYYLCEINKKIVNFYCRGHNCNLNVSCMKTNRWDFDNGLFVGLTPRAVETPAPVVPNTPVITPTPEPTISEPENVTLQKGADGCYTSNSTTLAKIRQENGIGITKQQFSGKRTMSSIVLPTSNTGTDDDPSVTVAQIRTAFNRTGTNIPQKVKDASPAFYNLGLLYDIDPVFILAFFKAERSMFNQGSPSITQTMINNNDISGVSYCRCGGVDTGNYCRYPTLEQGIEATYLNLTRGTTYSPNLYRNKSFSSVAKSWNGNDSYVTAMTGYLADTYTWAGK